MSTETKVQYYHVNDSEEVRQCRAQTPPACDFYKGEDNPRHFVDLKEATAFANKNLTEKYGTIPKANRFSLTRNFKILEAQFNADFAGFPTRFFNADLTGNTYSKAALLDPNHPNHERAKEIFDYKTVMSRLMYSASAPKDGDLGTAELTEIAQELGFESVKEVTDRKALVSFKASRGWIMTTKTGDELMVVPQAGAKNLRSYRWRRAIPEGFNGHSFTVLDARSLVGAQRLKRKTGSANLDLVVSSTPKELPKDDAALVEKMRRLTTYKMLELTMDAQDEGNNFRYQKKLYRETGGSVASAWEDKKNPDKTRQAMMANTVLNETFAKVEIDNDVDPAEFAQFEQEYLDIKDKLPKIPKDRQPELRLRKLGKHKAAGLFVGTGKAGAICVDIRDTSAMIHETYHYYDRVTMDNISLSPEFRGMAKTYKSTIEFPPSTTSAKRDYYMTPTEIHSRAAEIYAYERLGIQNRLVNPERFTEFDYAPIQNNPELKKELFDFFDTQYGTGS